MASAQEQVETVQRGEGQLSAPHQGLSAFFRAVEQLNFERVVFTPYYDPHNALVLLHNAL